MSPDVSTVLLPFINEALRDFGPWAAIPAVVGIIGIEIRRKFDLRDKEIIALRQQITDLQEKRLQDARQLIQIAEADTAATRARTQSEERFADLLETMLRRNQNPGLFGWRG